MSGTICAILKSTFPWLGTDKDAGSGADVIDKLTEMFELYQRQPIQIAGKKRKHLVCPNPKCGVSDKESRFKYVEDIENRRDVNGFREDGVLLIEGFYETEGGDDGADPRIECQNCLETFAIPPDLEIDFV